MGFESDAMGTMHGREGTTVFESWRSMRLASNIYAGLMSPQDKIKLDGLENYVHPDTPAEIGTYMQVVIDKQGHIVGGRLLQDSTLSDYRIVDAYITPDNEIVLGENKIRPRMPDENVPWRQISNRPDTVAGYGIKDAYIAERLTGVINEHNLPERLRQPIATKKELKSAYSDVDVRLEAIRTLSYENFRNLFESIGEISSDVNTAHLSLKELNDKFTTHSNLSRQDLIATNSRLTNECNSLKNIISVLSTRLADVLEVLGRTDNGRAVNTFAGFTAPKDGTTWIQFGIDYIMEKDDGESIINQSFVAINDDGEVVYEYTSMEDVVCSYPDVVLKFNSGEVVVNPMAKIIFGDGNVVIAGSGITQLFKPNYIENGEKARIVLDNGITIPVLSEYKVQGVYANNEIQEGKSEEGTVLPESPSYCTDEVITDDDFDDIFS